MAVTAPKRPSRRMLERTGMTPEQELELLIAEQAADDASTYADVPRAQISLDAVDSSLVGYDPWDLVDGAISLGLDPTEVAFSGDPVCHLKPRRGEVLTDPSKVAHGTASAYQHAKCRCIPCTSAWATYKRERRAAKKAAS